MKAANTASEALLLAYIDNNICLINEGERGILVGAFIGLAFELLYIFSTSTTACALCELDGSSRYICGLGATHSVIGAAILDQTFLMKIWKK